MDLGTLIVDAGGVVTWADPHATAMLAVLGDPSLEQPLTDLLHFSAENRQRLSDFLHARQSKLTLEQVTHDDLLISIHLHCLGSETDHSGGAMQYRCRLSIRDDAVIERTALAAVQLRSTIQSIIAGFAHEVRNPLAAILSIIESVIQADNLDSDSRSHLGRIPELIGRIDSLIRQAYDYSKPAVPSKESIDPLQIVSNAADMMRLKYPHVKFCIAEYGKILLVHVDARQIERTLYNLLENAAHAARSIVTVSVSRTKLRTTGGMVLEISDDGPGIPENIRRHIFQPFFTTKAKGTGLGLALARDLARINGGDLRLRSSTPEGTTFRLLLPTQEQTPRIKRHF